MVVDFLDFIAHGKFGEISPGAKWDRVVELLGEPELYEPPDDSSPAFARYGDLEFTIRNNVVAVMSLQLDGAGIRIPPRITMVNFDDPNLDTDEVITLLRDKGVSWEREELLCDDWQDYLRTEQGVHLSFGGGLLGKVGAVDPVVA